MSNHLSENDLILHYYGETERADEARIESHLAGCEECQTAKAALAGVMRLVDSASPVEAPPGFERIAWARLEPELDRPGRSGWRRLFWFPQWALAAGVAALVVAAFVAGRFSGGDPLVTPQT
jgi:anti-sigma factor RsiW